MLKRAFLIGTALVLGACGGPEAKPYPHAVMTPAPAPMPAAALVDTAGKPFTVASLQGHWVWLYLGFTHCPDVCPLALDAMAAEHAKLKHPEAVKVLFVSVDPKRDRPDALKAFVTYYDKAFLGATGPDAVLAPFAKALGASYVLDKPKAPGGDYNVSHTNMIFALDPEGRHVATYVASGTPGGLSTDFNALTEKEGGR